MADDTSLNELKNQSENDMNNLKYSDDQTMTLRPAYHYFGFLAGITLASGLGGFFITTALSRRKNPKAFEKIRSVEEDAIKLASKALAWGTLLALGGTGVLVFSVKTIMGVKSAKEFGDKMKSVMAIKSHETKPTQKAQTMMDILNEDAGKNG